MGRASFSQAIVQFSNLSTSADEAAYRAVETLERVILDHVPKTLAEAVAMLDVIIPDVSAGGRADGRDVKALRSIRTLLGADPA
jgi:hypothetical protein